MFKPPTDGPASGNKATDKPSNQPQQTNSPLARCFRRLSDSIFASMRQTNQPTTRPSRFTNNFNPSMPQSSSFHQTTQTRTTAIILNPLRTKARRQTKRGSASTTYLSAKAARRSKKRGEECDAATTAAIPPTSTTATRQRDNRFGDGRYDLPL